jgi:outer membrane protein assembly factor BamB
MNFNNLHKCSFVRTFVVVFLGCLAAGAEDSPMFRNDAGHSGIYAGGVPQLHGVKWKFKTKGEVNSSPAVAGGMVYVGSNDGSLYAIDQQTGSQKWAAVTKGRVPSSPAVANGLVYFGSYDGYFYAADAVTGRLAWRFRNSGERRFAATHLHGSTPIGETMPDPYDVYLSSPVVWNGAVYFGSGDGNVYALDAMTGSLKWKFQTGDVVHSSPAIVDGKLFVGSWDSNLYALDAATGKELWRFKTEEDGEIHNQVGIQSSPAVVNDVVYFGCRDSNLYAVDAVTGKERWFFSNKGSWVITSPVVYDGKVYFATSDSATFHVLNATDGTPMNAITYHWPFFASPSIAGDILYLAGEDGKLVAIDIKSNKQLWSFQSDGSRQNLSTLSNSDGSPNYQAVFPSFFYDDLVAGFVKLHSAGMLLSSPVIVDGVVYVGSTDGNLYALQ